MTFTSLDHASTGNRLPMLVLLVLAWCTSAAAEPYQKEVGTLILVWPEGEPDAAEITGVQAEAQRLYASVVREMGIEPGAKITIVLGGNAEQQDGSWEYPRVDWLGRVLLFRYTPDWRNYFPALAHEYVHAFRIERRRTADWFFEEGFAEYIALRADSSLAGFPWFDYPVTVVAGQWIAAGEDIPLTELRDRHSDLNQSCKAQAYSLRSAFFVWLGKTFGHNKLLQMARGEAAGAAADYDKYFGKNLEQLEQDWRKALMAEYNSLQGAASMAKRFRTQSPIQYQSVCAKGEDF